MKATLFEFGRPKKWPPTNGAENESNDFFRSLAIFGLPRPFLSE
jgi:hypothetical protein